MPRESQTLGRILLALFAVSGFSGLIYESIWSHYLKLMLGHAAYAQTLVLAIFMGGMALGAWIASRWSERWSNPLAAYAVIEGLIGLFALVFHGVFVQALEALYNGILPGLANPALAGAARWCLAAGLILPQSVLLGMTFPLMCAAVLRIRPGTRGSGLGLLYFTNSIGACAGVLISGFWLIPRTGLYGTMRIAGVLNLLLAIVVWILARSAAARSEVPDARPEEAGARALAPAFLLAAFLTGAASFFYEIGWIRMLSLVLGSTSQAFELMLSAFILGLALGGLWIRGRLDRLTSPLRYAGHVQILMGLFALLTVPLYAGTFDAMAFLIENLEQTGRGYALFNAGSHLIALAVMLPATVMAGMTLPLFTYALLRRGGGERSIGRVYAANTVGAIVGVLAAVHVVMPALGTKGLIVSGAAVDMLLGLTLLLLARGRVARWELAVAATVAGVAFAAISLGVRPDPHKTASGVYRHGASSLPETSEVVYHRDGKTATIDLIRDDDGTLTISTNGKPDARIAISGEQPAADEITAVLLAALPLALHPGARSVANIGMGSGMTTHTLLGSTRLERVDTVEIEPAVLEAARQFGGFVERAYSDPRSRLHVEDAKTFFSSRKQRYDIIISEPSNPWVSGVSSLFSVEFYRHVEAQLNPGGILVQWLQLYETNLDLISSSFKALSTSFRDYTVFNTDNANILVVATNGGNLDRLDPWIFDEPLLRADLQRVGLRYVQDLELRRIGSRVLLHPVFAALPAPPNSDYFPYLSVHAPRSRYLGETAVELTQLQVAPIPVNEMLDPYVRRSMRPHTVSSHYAPTRARELAGQLVVGLTSETMIAAGGASAVVRVMQGLQPGACEGPLADESLLLERLAWLAAATNPYLRGAELDAMWARTGERLCQDRLSSDARDWLRLHRSVGRRDGAAMAALAGRLIDEASERMEQRELDYLLTAGLTGALSTGDRNAARDLAARFGELYPPGATPPFYLRVPLAMLENAPAP